MNREFILYLRVFIFCSIYTGILLDISLMGITISMGSKVSIEKNSTSISNVFSGVETESSQDTGTEISAPLPKAISNKYIVLSGKFQRYPVWLFLSFKTEKNHTVVEGVFAQERYNQSMGLLGVAGEGEMQLREVDGADPTSVGPIWTLTDRGQGRWRLASPKGRMNLKTVAIPPKKEFKFQGKDIHPKVIGLLFEKANGNRLSVPIRNYKNRPSIRDGEWVKANLEYGYVRYRVLSHREHSWVLETERSGGRHALATREIIHTVMLKDALVLFKIVDQDNPPRGLLSEVLPGNPLIYQKKVIGSELIGYFPDLKSNSTLSLISEEDTPFSWCDSCSHGVLTVTYDVAQNHRMVESLELVPGTPIRLNNKAEKVFQETLESYVSEGVTLLKDEELQSLIDTWLKRLL